MKRSTGGQAFGCEQKQWHQSYRDSISLILACTPAYINVYKICVVRLDVCIKIGVYKKRQLISVSFIITQIG